MHDARADAAHLPRWLSLWWLAAAPGAALFIARILYEETYLTWRYGFQSVGFTLAHTAPHLVVWGSVSLLLLLLWGLGTGVWLVRMRVQRRPVSRRTWWLLAGTGVALALFFLPSEAWQLLFTPGGGERPAP